MPEAAEVRVIAEYLNKVWKNLLIVAMGWDSKSKFNKTGMKGLELVKVPCKVIGVYPRGKVIIIECINSQNETIYMISQLGMEGRWVNTKEKHSNFRIYFGKINDSHTEYVITDTWFFDDSRHFGHFNIFSDLSEIKTKHGPCLLTTALIAGGYIQFNDLQLYQDTTSVEMFIDKTSNRRLHNKQICDFLMDQKYFSGIGNYLRAEILYRCKINPKKLLGSFDQKTIIILYNTILEQMLIAYGARGLTIKSYWDPEGNAGKCPLQVYNKERDPYGNPVERFSDKQNRTVHWVPEIQTC
jgi:formamidopyrimidine-DNA glycosylase